MVLFPFTQSQRKKKKCVEREEEDGDDGFIPIHLVAKKKKWVWKIRRGQGGRLYSHSHIDREKKRGLKERKRMERMVLFPFTQLLEKEKKGFEREMGIR